MDRADSFSAAIRLCGLRARIGAIAHSSVVNSMTTNVNVTTGGFIARSARRGMSGASATIARAIEWEARRPAMPPASERIRVSIIHRRARAPRVAPSATSTACSRRRDETRVSMRPDRFAHPTSKRTPTAASNAHNP